MNHLIFFVLLEMLFESKDQNFLLEALIKQEYHKRFKKKPTPNNLKTLIQNLECSGKYDDLPWDADPKDKKKKDPEINNHSDISENSFSPF